MKKLFYIVMLLGSLSLFACNDNSGEVYQELEVVNMNQVESRNFIVDTDDR